MSGGPGPGPVRPGPRPGARDPVHRRDDALGARREPGGLSGSDEREQTLNSCWLKWTDSRIPVVSSSWPPPTGPTPWTRPWPRPVRRRSSRSPPQPRRAARDPRQPRPRQEPRPRHRLRPGRRRYPRILGRGPGQPGQRGGPHRRAGRAHHPDRRRLRRRPRPRPARHPPHHPAVPRRARHRRRARGRHALAPRCPPRHPSAASPPLPHALSHQMLPTYPLRTLPHHTSLRSGRAARLTRGEASTGAADDLASATALATQMVCQYGLGTIGPVSYTPLPRAIPASAATPSTPNGSSTRKSPPSWPAPRPALWSYSPATSTPSQSSPPPCSATRPSPATRYAPSPAEPPPAGRMNRILLLSVLVISR